MIYEAKSKSPFSTTSIVQEIRLTTSPYHNTSIFRMSGWQYLLIILPTLFRMSGRRHLLIIIPPLFRIRMSGWQHLLIILPQLFRIVWWTTSPYPTTSIVQDVRLTTADHCYSPDRCHSDPESCDRCQNGGVCRSTDLGPVCDCSRVRFKGTYCETG